MKKLAQIIATTTVVLFLGLVPAAAQDYPARTTTIICPYAPGGATDILARMLARGLEERLGKSFVVENRPGAGTVLAAHIVAKATAGRLHAADGHQHAARHQRHAAPQAAL